MLFSRDEATLYERVSVRPSVGWSVTLSLFGLLGATYAVYSALLHVYQFLFLHRYVDLNLSMSITEILSLSDCLSVSLSLSVV